MRILQFLFLIPLTCMLTIPMRAQQPICWWDFEALDWRQSHNADIRFRNSEVEVIHSGENGISGRYISLGPDNRGQLQTSFSLEAAVTVELVFRLPSRVYHSDFELLAIDGLSVAFSSNRIMYRTQAKNGRKRVNDVMSIPLNGSGRHSFAYYSDTRWHHLVAVYDASAGIKQLWIDGELQEGFEKQVSPADRIPMRESKQVNFTLSANPGFDRDFWGDLDEVAVFAVPLRPRMIEQHFRQVMAGQPYTFSIARNLPPVPDVADANPIPAGIDPREFAPGHPNPDISALEQLQHFPLARYATGHGLLPLYNWLNLQQMAGRAHVEVSERQQTDLLLTVVFQAEMAQHWHYYLTIQNSKFAANDRLLNQPGFLAKWIELANAHPEWPLAITSYWPQTNPRDIGEASPRPYIQNWKQMPPEALVRDEEGNYLNRAGKIHNRGLLSPAADEGIFAFDGQTQRYYFERMLSQLTRPVDMVAENGEVPPHPFMVEALEADPNIVAHRQRLGNEDWDTYQAAQKLRFRIAYRDAFLNLPQLRDARFGWYAVDGGPLDRYEWTTSRLIHRPIGGQYYSTPDFYPRWPNNWEKWKGPWRGWDWIDQCRKQEIPAGDRLFSPFIGAGWSANPEENVRPSQWLGLLKNLSATGAEFFYNFHYSPQGNPADFIWQVAVPAYAQAITSHYEDILRNGDLLRDTQGLPITRHWVGDPRILFTVRKHDLNEVYVIAASLQPISNLQGNVPDQATAIWEWQGMRLRCEVRRQGSVYIWDRRDPEAPVFYQLDRWHETGHPSWWSSDFRIEAEMMDLSDGLLLATERPPQAEDDDFRDYTTYVTANRSTGGLSTCISPRHEQSKPYRLRVRVRNRSSRPVSLTVTLDEKQADTLTISPNQAWHWVDLQPHNRQVWNLHRATYDLRIDNLPGNIDLDQIEVLLVE